MRDQAGALNPPVRTQLILRWSARLTSTLMLLLLLISVGVERPDLGALAPVDWILTLFLSWTCVGWILAWRWEARGGALSVASLLALHFVGSATESVPPGWALPAMAIPGLFFIASSFVGQRASAQRR
jgi:hypothetical protein